MKNFLNKILLKILSIGSVKRRLEVFSQIKIFFKILNRFSYPNSIYESYTEATIASHKIKPISHLDTDMIKSNFSYGLKCRPSDYPALFWLSQISLDTPLCVFDFGGGAGQLFYQYRELLPSGSIDKWIVYDLPEVVEYGKKMAAEKKVDELFFTTKLPDCKRCNVFLAAGSLHYWDSSIEELKNSSQNFPQHFIINRSPMRENGPEFITLQVGGNWAVPCLVRNFQKLSQDMTLLNYDLIDSWVVEEKTLAYPWLPHFKSPYRGAYFRKENDQ